MRSAVEVVTSTILESRSDTRGSVGATAEVSSHPGPRRRRGPWFLGTDPREASSVPRRRSDRHAPIVAGKPRFVRGGFMHVPGNRPDERQPRHRPPRSTRRRRFPGLHRRRCCSGAWSSRSCPDDGSARGRSSDGNGGIGKGIYDGVDGAYRTLVHNGAVDVNDGVLDVVFAAGIGGGAGQVLFPQLNRPRMGRQGRHRSARVMFSGSNGWLFGW